MFIYNTYIINQNTIVAIATLALVSLTLIVVSLPHIKRVIKHLIKKFKK